ncbi:unnamed protein product [Tuber aestivum]|uniref:Myb-like domain-containing protein n=1 Tax=Tuber aestivum TaxID=59557 RepID=A0A292PRK2_9PEZI|nr:unnamed protein product [Tuber aestivum]
MATQEVLEFFSCNESTGEDKAVFDPVDGELTGVTGNLVQSESEAEEIVQVTTGFRPSAIREKDDSNIRQAEDFGFCRGKWQSNSGGDIESRERADITIDEVESQDECSSSSDGEGDEEQVGSSWGLSSGFDSAQAVETTGAENSKRKRGEEDEDNSGSTDDESGENDDQAALLDEAESPLGARPSLKKKRKSTAEEKSVSTLTPPPTPKEPKAEKTVKGSERGDEVANVKDTGTNVGGPSVGGPQPKPKRGRKKKQAGAMVVKQGVSSSPAKPRGRPRKIVSKDPKTPNNGDVPPRGQSKSAEGGGITAGEIGIIFDTLTAEADWPAIVAKTNALVGLKRLGQNVSKHWKTIAKKRLLDTYGA